MEYFCNSESKRESEKEPEKKNPGQKKTQRFMYRKKKAQKKNVSKVFQDDRSVVKISFIAF